jgi:hypothetical protein
MNHVRRLRALLRGPCARLQSGMNVVQRPYLDRRKADLRSMLTTLVEQIGIAAMKARAHQLKARQQSIARKSKVLKLANRG